MERRTEMALALMTFGFGWTDLGWNLFGDVAKGIIGILIGL